MSYSHPLDLSDSQYSEIINFSLLAGAAITFSAIPSTSTINNLSYGSGIESYTNTPNGSSSPAGIITINAGLGQYDNLANTIYDYIGTPPPASSTTFYSIVILDPPGKANETFIFSPYTIYHSPTHYARTTSDLYFNADGDPNAQFFIIVDEYIELTSNNLYLNNGAKASNIFWLARNMYTTITTSAQMYGYILSKTYFTSTNVPLIDGNIFSKLGAITLTGNITVNASIVCFLKGTKILTTDGYKLIEDLKVGEKIITKGEIKEDSFVLKNSEFSFETIKWLGHFTAPNLNKSTFPICIKKNALGINQPFEDLFVSPGHRLILDDKMILAIDLVNDDTIYQDTSKTELIYYHIEFHNHCAIVANGILAESYLDSDNRYIFEKNQPSKTNEIMQPKSILA